MAGPLNAKIIIARCAKTKQAFGIRVEERENDWIRTWAFPIDEKKASKEGFDTNTISGTLQTDPEYPGCPFCGSEAFIVCSCGKIGCNGDLEYKGVSAYYKCPFCECRDIVHFADNFQVSGTGY